MTTVCKPFSASEKNQNQKYFINLERNDGKLQNEEGEAVPVFGYCFMLRVKGSW